jgi:predicted Rossmann fold nucleotide-binding protein DprA/Smf involved in DNA uptake
MAVVGSRSFDDQELLERTLDDQCRAVHIDKIVSGGARGADALAEIWADRCGIQTQIFLPDWDRHGRSAGFIRNRLIVENCDELVAFWDGKSRGTLHSIELARSMNKSVLVVEFNKEGQGGPDV